ncbi:transposase (plasmid) [Paraburkholderia phytofirmans OLGA172]|uniref:Transposase n=1 Tax=Paraburkholderia phytofirmans OLGA172 TaxID=1417228 RepID=A0A160FIQ1_9BURK|nr:IS4 family transposase [Paraburkholderia phytofirmans]ANB71758.1 transposase [Paraburkholderia phytofirmans OLGA172]ANB72136.1 transposase [Paraburkholderia phytofirmans OLGA172]ANB73092.1 transposase [Paraburkholderia phytofirmans OLGA172]ANB75651.1 transposase [Paraburkholderia phytofirmans OLGA172]ANB76163.1 transposase [Paraburkholderia phytofirmans OLGA172]
MKIRNDAGAWVDEEFETLDLGDPRRDRRAKELIKRFASRPTASIPGACEGWAETMAAYRFLGNERIDWRDMMQPHWDRTTARMGALPVVLCIADTTELNFNGQDIEGAGPLSYEAQVGMYLHATYAVTPDREPLGVMNAWMWARESRDANGRRGGVRESARWIESYEIVAEQARALPDARLVYVADREGDIAALMQRAQELGEPADWLIRSQHNRALKDEEKLWDKVHAGNVLGRISFVLPGRSGQKAREVKQELRSQRITLPGRVSVTLTCVEAYEVDAPAGVKPVIWRLVTNREAGDADALIELIDWYRARWEIEMFFNVLKNACRVEALQLSQMERVEKALALYMVVSWRIARLMRVGRTCPELNASLFFAADEIHGAHVLCKKARPKKPPTLNQMIRMIASLGGFLGRKSDGEPGAKTLWIGMQRVMDAVSTIQILRDGYDTSV